MAITTYISRALQLAFSITALGLAVYLEHWWQIQRSIDYGGFGQVYPYMIFVGAFGTAIAASGLIPPVVHHVPWLIRALLDTFAATFFVTGGSVMSMFISSFKYDGDSTMCWYNHAVWEGDCDLTASAMQAITVINFVAFAVCVNLVGAAVREHVEGGRAVDVEAGQQVHAAEPVNGVHEK